MDVEHPPKLPKIKKLPKTKKHKLWKGKRVTKSEKKNKNCLQLQLNCLSLHLVF